MKRIASVVLLAAALACGSGEPQAPEASPTQERAGGTTAGSTGSDAGGAGSTDSAESSASEAALHPSVPRCLDLVRAGQLVEAVTPCTEAVRNAPGNEEVAAALDEAKAAASEQATAAARDAADSAASGAAADAAGSLQEQGGSLPTQLP
jgi:hypothetical protein